MTSAVRPLRTALVLALKTGVPLVSNRVFTPPVTQGTAVYPRIILDGYAEDPRNFFGRAGGWVRCQVKGQAFSESGDTPREAVWEQVHETLHRQPLTVDGHLLLSGTLRRIATYSDPSDNRILHFVGSYEGETKIA